MPCKHLAATFYLLADSFDDDPFTILAWRGRERDDLLATNLQAARWGRAGQPAARRVPRLLLLSASRHASAEPVATSSTTLLDQLPDIGVAVRDRPPVELLRPI